MDRFTYRGSKTNEISFPLGGIGAGCIALAGNGRLIDWEIFNRPNKGSLNGLSHFAVKAERGGKVLDARVLQGDLHPPYSGEMGVPQFSGFGWGPRRENLCGMPHFRRHEFRGEFPFARLAFGGEKFPGRVALDAWSPFIPTNDRDSGLPAAFFEIEIENDTARAIDYTVVAALSNPFGAEGSVNRATRAKGIRQLTLTNSKLAKNDTAFGDLTLSTDADDVSAQEYWFRGRWCDSLEVYWRDFTRPGRFANRTYPEGGRQGCWEGRDTGHLAARVRVAPGKKRRVRFVITWNVPNCRNYWSKTADEQAAASGLKNAWKNWYATAWRDSSDSGRYALAQWTRLFDETTRFHDTLFASTIPPVAIEGISAALAVLKTPTCLRLEDGTFYGWEGTGCTGGCCEGSCTHVWGYAQALAFLFPKLERSMRAANYAHAVDEHGGSHFRLKLPLGVKATPKDFRPCADGQFGDVVKAYRDWKISGDTEWLRRLWPAIRKTIEYAWSDRNYDRWDPEKTGVLWGRQHHTLDMELFGPNAWLTGFYLAALKAGAEMATALGEEDFASELSGIFKRGKAWTDRELFNGEYYAQRIDLKDKSLLDRFAGASCECRGPADDAAAIYWSNELGEIKYQVGEGCEIDMVLAQWHANLCSLGEIFDPAQTRRALAATFKHNFIPALRDAANPWRLFALNDESALVMCTWPEGRVRPTIPVPYAQESMHGFEWAAASHMVQAGLAEEALAVVKSIRDRYDGEKRNPWNEIECGSNYARSLAAYSLLNAFSGFRFDMTRGMIGFAPVASGGSKSFRCFWGLDSGWGEAEFTRDAFELRVLYGSLSVRSLALPRAAREVIFRGGPVPFRPTDGTVTLNKPCLLEPGKPLRVRLKR